MARLPNPLVADLLEIADHLAKQGGRANLRQTAARRAVSTAYYAVFHALCTICADGLVGWNRTDLVERIYRSLDHASARKRLAALAARAGASSGLQRVGVGFGELQDQRHLADYERSRSLFSSVEVEAVIGKARDLVDILAALSRDERRSFAVDLLLAKPR